jgi:hypothetical protein
MYFPKFPDWPRIDTPAIVSPGKESGFVKAAEAEALAR